MFKSTFLFSVEDFSPNYFPKSPKRNDPFFQLPNTNKLLPSKKFMIINWRINGTIRNNINPYDLNI